LELYFVDGNLRSRIIGTTSKEAILSKLRSVTLNVSLPGVEREVAQALVDAAHQTCPYSKATRGNIDAISVV